MVVDEREERAGGIAENKIRIAQVLGNAGSGGVISWLMNFYRRVDRERFAFDFYMYSPSPYDEEIRSLGGRVFYYPKVFNVIGAFGTLRRCFKREKYDIVHVHMTTLSFVALAAAKSAGVSVRICHAHTSAHSGEGWKYFVKVLIRPLSKLFATHLAGCSELAINWFYGKKHASCAKLIHNAVDLTRFEFDDEYRRAAREELSLPNGRVIGFVGRLEKQKNAGFAVETFALVAGRSRDTYLLIVGSGSEREALKKKIAALGLSERVLLMPERRDVEKYFAVTDVLVMPSLFEGLPLVAIEAQAAGIPVILSDNITRETGLTENCRFLSLKSRRAWAEAVVGTLESRDAGRSEGALAGGPFDIRAEAHALEEYYSSLAARKGERS